MDFRLISVVRLALPLFLAAMEASATGVSADKLVQMNCGARIECTTPDGQVGRVSRLADPSAVTALISEDDTVTCLLKEGRTDFVVELPKAATLDRLTFLSENSLARGELRIAVSHERLKADSKEWVEVEGIVPFSHKRLFGVSLIGIEAKFVRLSFNVEKGEGIGAVNSEHDISGGLTSDAEEPFSEVALRAAIASQFATAAGRDNLLRTAKAASVQPLSLGSR